MNHSVFQCYYECCSKTFRNQVYLVTHINTQHLQAEVLYCDLCDVVFKSEFKFKRHIKRHELKKSQKKGSSNLLLNFTLNLNFEYIPPNLLCLPVLPAIENERSRCAFDYKLPLTVRVYDLLNADLNPEGNS